jgi:hypothetical protein
LQKRISYGHCRFGMNAPGKSGRREHLSTRPCQCDLRIFSLTPQRAESTSSACAGRGMNMCAKVERFLASSVLRLGPCARLTREGVRLTVHRPAHPVDGSGPRSRARRIFPNDRVRASERAQVYPPKCLRMCTPASRCLGAQHCLLHASGRHLRAIWSHRDILAWSWRNSLSVQSLMDHACVCAVYGLRRACARTAVRPVSVSMFAATRHR